MLLHEYETTIIIRPDVDAADVTAILDGLEGRLAEADAKLLIRDDWGKRKLAYSIANQLKGQYVLFNYLANADKIAEFERRIRNEDRIVRFLTVRTADAPDVAARMAEAEELRARKAEEAQRRAEAEEAAERQQAEAAAAQIVPPTPV